MRKLIVFVIIFFSLLSVIRSISIRGNVFDNMKSPLIGVRVEIIGSNIITFSKKKGSFLIEIPKEDYLNKVELQFSFKNYYKRLLFVDLRKIKNKYTVIIVRRNKIEETINVTALNRSEEKLAIPMAETTLSDHQIKEKITENIVETIIETPGVHFIGKGGYSITPSIRGLARRRVLLMIDGFRISGDRSAGSSASFLIPGISRGIDIIRSSSSVFYGSDAIGGVVNILTRPVYNTRFENIDINSMNFNYNSVNSRINNGLTYGISSGKINLYSGFQYTKAGNYKAGDIIVYNSGYEVYSGIFDLSYSDKKRDLYIGYIGGEGIDIGKPDRENDQNIISTVPKESNHFIRFGYNEHSLIKDTTLSFSAVFNPSVYKIRKEDFYNMKDERSDTSALNFGIKTFLSNKLSEKLQIQAGFEWFSRQNLHIENLTTFENVTRISTPLKNGYRNDLGYFLSLSFRLNEKITFDCGGRYSFFSIGAYSDGKERALETSSPAFFFGINNKINNSLSMFLNIGRAFRVPALSELFYSGITGRRLVEGNPDLISENSLNIDTGFRFLKNNWYLGLYIFHYKINNMIERYRNEDEIYTYDNLDKGMIYGGEIEFSFPLLRNVEINGHYFYYKGRSALDTLPLNDIPAPRLFIQSLIYINNIKLELSLFRSFKKNDPGSTEIFNKSYTLLNFKGIIYISSKFNLFVKISNILNQKYYANPDPDIPPAKGLDLSLGLRFGF